METAEGAGDDDLRKVLDQVGLEGRPATLIGSKVLEELLDGVAEALVQRVLVELAPEELDLIGNAVGVVAVTLAEEVVPTVVDLVPLLRSAILHDEALLLETFSDIVVQMLEPRPQVRVLVGVPVDGVDRLDEIIGRGTVSETLNQQLESCQY